MRYRFGDYNDRVLDHYENPRNVGEVEGADAVGEADNPACGDRMRLSLRIRDGVVVEARFKAFGCAAAIATSSMTTEMVQGRSLEDVGRLTNRAVAEALGGLPPAKMHCSVLAEDAVRAALADHRRRSLRGDAADAVGATRGTAVRETGADR